MLPSPLYASSLPKAIMTVEQISTYFTSNSLFIDWLTWDEVRAAAGRCGRSCRPVPMDVAEILAVKHVIHRLIDDAVLFVFSSHFFLTYGSQNCAAIRIDFFFIVRLL